jgi:hypothetical protein
MDDVGTMGVAIRAMHARSLTFFSRSLAFSSSAEDGCGDGAARDQCGALIVALQDAAGNHVPAATSSAGTTPDQAV